MIKSLLFIQFLYVGIVSGQILYEQIKLQILTIGSCEILLIEKSGLSITMNFDMNYQYLVIYNDIESKNTTSIVDSMDLSPYSTEIKCYKSTAYQDYIIFWITEYEYNSEIHLFYYQGKKLNKISSIPIQNSCDSCYDSVYPIDQIKIKGNEEVIELMFLEPFEYNLGEDAWVKYQPGEMNLIFDKKSKKLKMH